MDERRRIPDWLLWLWVILVVGYFAWEMHAYRGLYGWLAELQLAWFGKFDVGLTAIIPGAILAGPALATLGTRARWLERAEALAGDPAAITARTRRWSLVFAVLSALVAAGAYGWSTMLLDRTGQPARIDLAALGDAEPYGGAVIISGFAVPALTLTYREDIGVGIENRFVPLTAKGAASGPLRFFLKTNATAAILPGQIGIGRYDDPEGQPFRVETQVGVLIPNDLPGPVRAAFERGGVALADPYYVLDLTPEGERLPYYVAAGVASLLAVCLLVLAIAQTILIRRIRRQPPPPPEPSYPEWR